jgi:anhydro-N-acetylmuramic acid kinase
VSDRRHIAGCMTGTSIDGLDVALVEVTGTGLALRARVRRCLSRPLGGLAKTLRALADQEPLPAGRIAAAARDLALLHADALSELAAGERLDLVCVHGQTVYHAPPVSWQLMNPAPICRALGAPVVHDLRAADLAAGGQGAPITPIADALLFREVPGAWAVVNLGGFCNITVRAAGPAPGEPIDPGAITAGDVCACNQVLDAIARRLMNSPFDAEGARAAAGTVHEEALEDLDGIFVSQARAKRSLGTGDEVGEWISRFRARVSAEDLAATACEAIGSAIARRAGNAGRVLLAGGGVRNAALVAAIGSCCTAPVSTTDAHGVPAAYREAAGFAVLGALCQDRVPITLPQVTGVASPAPVAGAWVYP